MSDYELFKTFTTFLDDENGESGDQEASVNEVHSEEQRASPSCKLQSLAFLNPYLADMDKAPYANVALTNGAAPNVNPRVKQRNAELEMSNAPEGDALASTPLPRGAPNRALHTFSHIILAAPSPVRPFPVWGDRAPAEVLVASVNALSDHETACSPLLIFYSSFLYF